MKSITFYVIFFVGKNTDFQNCFIVKAGRIIPSDENSLRIKSEELL